MPLIPFFESNQGLLSLLALLAALWIAAWEHLRAERATIVEFGKDVDIAIETIDAALEALASLSPVGGETQGELEIYRTKVGLASDAMKAMAQARPHSARHAFAMQLAVRNILAAGNGNHFEMGRDARAYIKDGLEKARIALDESRPSRSAMLIGPARVVIEWQRHSPA